MSNEPILDARSSREATVSDNSSHDSAPLLGEVLEEEPRTLPSVGSVISFIAFGLSVFSVLSFLQVEEYIKWNWWVVSAPLVATLLGLLFLTQSRTLTSKMPLIVRLSCVACVVAGLVFVVLLCLRKELQLSVITISSLFLPIWILLTTLLVFGIISCFVGIVATCTRSDPSGRKQKYYSIGLPLILIDVIAVPFTLLLELKLVDTNMDLRWSYVFIPLWIFDGCCLIVSITLLLFTIGSQQDATFSISQVLTFLLIFPCFIAFKILLVLNLDGSSVPLLTALIPFFVAEALAFFCGLNLRFRAKLVPKKMNSIKRATRVGSSLNSRSKSMDV